jgi:hypothetical protein
MWDLWQTKWRWSRFYPTTTVSPASHSTDFSTLIIIHHQGLITMGPTVADIPNGFSFTPTPRNGGEGKKSEIICMHTYFVALWIEVVTHLISLTD